jgi:hypothetical protein
MHFPFRGIKILIVFFGNSFEIDWEGGKYIYIIFFLKALNGKIILNK